MLSCAQLVVGIACNVVAARQRGDPMRRWRRLPELWRAATWLLGRSQAVRRRTVSEDLGSIDAGSRPVEARLVLLRVPLRQVAKGSSTRPPIFGPEARPAQCVL